jgi:hypothetical protein
MLAKIRQYSKGLICTSQVTSALDVTLSGSHVTLGGAGYAAVIYVLMKDNK